MGNNVFFYLAASFLIVTILLGISSLFFNFEKEQPTPITPTENIDYIELGYDIDNPSVLLCRDPGKIEWEKCN